MFLDEGEKADERAKEGQRETPSTPKIDKLTLKDVTSAGKGRTRRLILAKVMERRYKA